MQQMKRLLFLLFGFIAISNVIAEWGYEGDNDRPNEWYREFPYCNGSNQSPINVICDDAVYINKRGPTITTVSEGSATLTNNMHSAQWAPGTGRITLTGPTLPGVYKLAQTHFHWGTRRAVGSEHTLNGFRASFEMHMVFVADRYANFNAAMTDNKYDGIAVVGVLFEETDIDNVMLDPVADNIDKVDEPNATVSVPYINFDGIDTSEVFEYRGSLTTPSCNEIVHWFLLPQLHSISRAQIAKFRGMLFQDNTNMGNNYRPAQPLNDRNVYRNFHNCDLQFVSEY